MTNGVPDQEPVPEPGWGLVDYEHRSAPLLPPRHFRRRLLGHAAAAAALVACSLLVGVLGYRYIAGFAWVDALLNASMILSGMGPVGELPSVPSKLFASAYALFSGIVFVASAGIIVAPIAHRLLHRLHIEESARERRERKEQVVRKEQPDGDERPGRS